MHPWFQAHQGKPIVIHSAGRLAPASVEVVSVQRDHVSLRNELGVIENVPFHAIYFFRERL